MFPIEYVIRCEATHFFFSAYLGYLAFYLTSTIWFRVTGERPTFLFSVLSGLFASVCTHMILDYFTGVA